MKVVKDESRCVSAGHCCFIAPSVFELRGGVMRIVKASIGEEDRDAVEEAIAQCPAEALSLQP